MQGTLYIVATPIGNLEDMTLRGLRILKEVDLIASEDTRKTHNLLRHFNIEKPTTSFFLGNENRKAMEIVGLLKAGKNIALVSNAGTPCISDPGFPLLRMAVEEGITVSPIPGASALISALSSSGIPTDKFTFFGFLPEKSGRRGRVVEEIKGLDHTAVIYMSVWKIQFQLKELALAMPNRRAALCRELTKIHEEFIRGTLSELSEKIAEIPQKGEFVLVIEGNLQ